MIGVEEARRLVLASVRGAIAAETLTLEQAPGRTLAEAVTAPHDIPPFASSAMDGFVVAPGPAGRRLRIAGEARAGHPSPVTADAGEAIRISTGAPLPPGGGAVVPLERVSEDRGGIILESPVGERDHVRGAGEDVEAGATVLAAGTRVGPVELGVAAACGRAELSCVSRPLVAVLATGDELVAPGTPLGAGQIYDSNAIVLAAAARRAGATVQLHARVGDDAGATQQALATALEQADVMVVSGGVSVGPHDHVKGALAALGVQERFWRVALRPGKPTWFGVASEKLVFGLPGNPVSACVCFALFVVPALRALLGREPIAPRMQALLAAPVAASPEREQAIGVRVEHSGDRVLAWPAGPQGSHRLSSLLGAQALALVPASEVELPAGTPVELESLADSFDVSL